MRGYAGEIVLVGINYDKKTKKHECVIERVSDKNAIGLSVSGELPYHTENHTENHTESHVGLSRLQKEVIQLLKTNPKYSRRELALKIKNASLGGIISAISRLQELGILRRVGPDKGGYWEIISTDQQPTNNRLTTER